MKRGFMLGKFMPPHAGHLFVCQTAEALVDELTILVCSLDDDPIPGVLRYEWMKALNPSARVLHLTDDVPQEPKDHPDFWTIWRGLCRNAHPEKVDLVFGSEPYVVRLAQELDAQPVVLDPDREAFPVSGTAIRENPAAHWQFIPRPVRAHYQKRVALVGPESTGKTTLAKRLADHFDTLWVPEYGRSYDRFRGDGFWSPADFTAIAHRHTASREAIAPEAGPILIEDTDPLLTAVWQEMLLGARPERADTVPLADHYLLMMDDAEWKDDGTRYFGDANRRGQFMRLCEDALVKRGASFTKIAGDWATREAAAIEAVRRCT